MHGEGVEESVCMERWRRTFVFAGGTTSLRDGGVGYAHPSLGVVRAVGEVVVHTFYTSPCTWMILGASTTVNKQHGVLAGGARVS